MNILKNINYFARTAKIAAVFKNEKLLYSELEYSSGKLAAFLVAEYPGNFPVIIWGDKENEMLICIIAAIKSCKPYVIVPYYYPETRVEFIVENCKACAVLNVSASMFPLTNIAVIDRDTIKQIIVDNDLSLLVSSGPRLDDTVCIFYTSGSTGVPKGVIISRKNIEAYVDWWYQLADLGINQPRVLNFSPYAFSASILAIYVHIGMLGATLYSVDKKMTSNYRELLKLIYDVNPHYLDCTPSFIDICLKDTAFGSLGIPAMSQLSLGGEALPHRIARQLLQRFPDIQILNGYGATETTIGTIACQVTQEMADSNKAMPIGYASFNSIVYVVDDNHNILPEGETGELVIVSDMISEGYLNNHQKTDKVFFVHESGIRGYYTNDLAWIKDGLVYYMGRKDNLVKVGGYRVEMEEVERYLSQVSCVAKCAVAPAQEDGRTVMLIAYVVLKEGYKKGMVTIAQIKKEMGHWIQEYMIPQKIKFLNELPKNPNDKIDRKLLKEMSEINK